MKSTSLLVEKIKIASVLIISFIYLPCHAQVVADFENFNLQRGEHINNSSPDPGFQSGYVELPNYYNPDFDFWSGFSISADTNTTTPGFTNQYSAIAGTGAAGTTTYAVGYIYDPVIVRLTGKAIGKPVIGLYVTNSTYAYLSMRDGDSFAKKFGGESGKDPDYLYLTVKKYAGGAIADDSVNVYLADYRSPNPDKDYILSDWKYVDLTGLGEVDSLVLRLTSSDVGIFGMNTPAYTCFDQISTDNLLAASFLQHDGLALKISPNPVHDRLYIDLPFKGQCAIMDIQGKVVWSESLDPGQHEVYVAPFAKGLYFVTFGGHVAARFNLD